MPKVKVPRKSTSVDMTAMCDVAFLLLTFFILTTQFKPQEPVVVDIPSSISETVLPGQDIMLITVAKDGRIFFGMDGKHHKAELIEKLGKQYNIQFTDEEKYTFSIQDNFGVPMRQLKQFLSMKSDERDEWIKKGLPGIPSDSVGNELGDWILFGRRTNPAYRIAVKGDKEAEYTAVRKVLNTLQNRKLYKFNMITGLEAKPDL